MDCFKKRVYSPEIPHVVDEIDTFANNVSIIIFPNLTIS